MILKLVLFEPKRKKNSDLLGPHGQKGPFLYKNYNI